MYSPFYHLGETNKPNHSPTPVVCVSEKKQKSIVFNLLVEINKIIIFKSAHTLLKHILKLMFYLSSKLLLLEDKYIGEIRES